MCCMEEGGAGIFGDIPNATFGDAVLVVRTNAAEGDCLVRCSNIVHKGFVGESSIITMVMEDSHPMLLGNALERVFRVDCFIRCEVLVHVDVCEVTCVVHEHRRTPILADCRLPFCNGYEAWNGGFKLVNADHSSCYGCQFDFWVNFVHSPGFR